MFDKNLLLLAYYIFYFLCGFVLRSYLVFRRTGVNPLVLPTAQSAHGYVGRAFKLLIFCCAGVVMLLAFAANAKDWLGVYVPLQQPMVEMLGWVLLVFSLLWMLLAQAQMGLSWRVGIDTQNATALVSKGLFSVSRNPIFLAMRLNLLGFLGVAPSAATFAICVAGEILMQVQVRLEEEHLHRLHGSDYSRYCAAVPRWL
jgi:protein-S-isoprenylcysteine O-methyltransferase Ste14